MKNVCILVIFCVALLTPAQAIEQIASARCDASLGVFLNNCFSTQVDTASYIGVAARDMGVDVSDGYNKHYGESDPPTHSSYVSLASNPLSFNRVWALSNADYSVNDSQLGLSADCTTDATMYFDHGGRVEALGWVGNYMQFKRVGSGTVTVTADYSYALDLLNAANTRFPEQRPWDIADSYVILRVGLLNAAGQSMLSSKDGWAPDQYSALYRSYRAGAGDSIYGGETQTTWQLYDLGNTDTYTLIAEVDLYAATAAPEPATIVMLGLGALGLLKKRRA